MKKKSLFIISFIVIVLIILIIVLFINKKDNIVREEMILDFHSDYDEKLREFNTYDEYKYGWLQVQGTLIDVPILTAYIDDSSSYGWITKSSYGYSNRSVLVGHNMLNVSSTPMVNNPILSDFEDLMAFSYYDFAKDNMYISFYNNGIEEIYVVYAVGFFDYDYDNAEGIFEKDKLKNYIKKVKDNSIYSYDVDVNSSDKIITVKTCTRMFGKDEKQQFQLDARKLRDGEKIYKYNVKKTKVYNELKLKNSYQNNEEEF